MSVSMQPVPLKLGPYELLQRIATGGMAEVYLARRAGPHGFQKIVAVKRILPQLARDSDFVAMFIDEARVAARLGHPNIVQVFDFGEHEDEMYMAMEYVDGATGARLIRAAAAQDEPIPLDVSMQVVLSVARALEHAHAAKDEEGKPLHLVHRDVSPGNVLIDRSGAVKLTDFGIVRAEEVERRTEAGQLKGKLGYMSPEQVVGRELDGRSDIFTLGIVLAEMIMLKPLFSGGGELDVLIRIRDANLKPLDQDTRVPDDVRGVLLRALARDPANRYANASLFAEAIEEIIRRRRLHVSPVLIASFGEKLGVFAPDLSAPLEDESLSSPTLAASERETSMPPAGERIDPSQELAPAIWRVEDESPDSRHLREISDSMSYPKIVELFATGGIGITARIARESGEFRSPAAYPELARFVKSPALSWEPLFPPETIERAPIAHGDFPSRIFDLVMRKDTGVLVLRDGERKKKVYFVEGTPEFIASTDKRELLGENLVEAGSVLRMEVDMALAMLPRYGGRLGTTRSSVSACSVPSSCFAPCTSRCRRASSRSSPGRAARWASSAAPRSHEETFPLGIDPLELVVRGVREAFSAGEITSLLSPIEDTRLKATKALPMRLEALQLPHRESTLLRGIGDGEPRSMRELVTQSLTAGMTQHEVRFALFLGLSAGLLRSA